GNTPALGPIAAQLKVLTLFVDRCTDFLFDKAVPDPKYIFRITNIQSADGVTCALAVAQTYPEVRKIAHIHPDYSYGRNAFDHIRIVSEKLLPGSQIVMEGWPKLGTTDFSAHIAKAISANPDILITSARGGGYTGLLMLRRAIEKANKLTGGWPDDEAIISQLEGLSYVGPGGYVSIRADNHQGYKDAMTGFTKNYPAYPFQTMDTSRVIVIPIRSITAPPGWKGNDPTRTYDWINKTWPKVTG